MNSIQERERDELVPVTPIQVGLYCDHNNEPMGEGTHMSSHGKWRKKKGWIETFPEPHVRTAITFVDHHDPAKPPHCPRAVPVYIEPQP
ncbi:hypothetical protein [Paenarthrobacter nicotinovorans]|uniref:hypothetical protein n=1 Tax=Paenarthrobacter nicotinovorans TaxID=29320 RepID=UPI0039A4A95F